MFDQILTPPSVSNNSLATALNYINTTMRVKFDGSCLKQDKVTFTLKQVVNIDLVYEITLWPSTIGQDFVLGNSLFFTDVNLRKMLLILINMNILAMRLYFMHTGVFHHFMVVGLVKM